MMVFNHSTKTPQSMMAIRDVRDITLTEFLLSMYSGMALG
jgi:hypothetical protein